MKTSRVELRSEHFFLLCLLLVAIALRMVDLGRIPPFGEEAVHLLRAAARAGEASPFWTKAENPANMVFFNLTWPLLQVFGSSPAVGRIASAAAGSLLILSVLLLRKREGYVFTFVMAGLLTLSPIAVTLSRTAGSSITAALGIALAAFGYLHDGRLAPDRRAVLIGIGLGLAIASGPGGLTGLATLLLAWGMARLFKLQVRVPPALPQRTLLTSALVSATVAATGFGLEWGGLASVGTALGAWLEGWIRPGTSGIAAQGLQLIAFEPMLLIFGAIGIWLAWKRQVRLEHRLMSFWALSALLINLTRVGRQPEDLIWIVIPLAWLSALAFASLIESKHERQWLQLIVLTCLLLVLAASAHLAVSSYLQGFQLSRLGTSVPILYFIFGALFLMAASLLLIFGMEWSWAVALDALGLAVFVMTMGLSLQATWRLNFPLRDSGARLLWSAGGTSPGLSPLLKTLENASLAERGFPHELRLQVPDDLPAPVAFALRDFPRASGEFDPGQGAPPALLLPESQPDVQLLDEYYGQAFALIMLPAWDTNLTPNIARWWVLNEAPSDSQRWVLWVRADIAGLGEPAVDGGP